MCIVIIVVLEEDQRRFVEKSVVPLDYAAGPDAFPSSSPVISDCLHVRGCSPVAFPWIILISMIECHSSDVIDLCIR